MILRTACIAIITVALAAGIAGAQDSITGQARVIDGDTIVIHGLRIRLQGIDTPERYQRCRDAHDRVYRCGDTATEALRRAIGSSAVRCDLEARRGRYERAIGTCYGWDGRDLNRMLVRHGHALAYRRYSRRYVTEESHAKSERLGLHNGTYVAPWDWRRGRRLK